MSEAVARTPEIISRDRLDWPALLEEALTLPGALGNTYNRFYNYSFGNQVLMYVQGLREPVATYKRWQELGRQVKRGSKAKAIVRPVTRKRTVEVDGQQVDVPYTTFKLVSCIFGYSETEGDELPEPEPRQWSPDQALAALDVTEVPFESLNGNIAGYSRGRELAINPAARYPLKTLLHELAHCVLDHSSADFGYVEHRGIAEFEAEGTAYLILNELEAHEHFDPAESRAYIAGWLQGQEVPDRSARRVFTATSKILDAGRLQGGAS